MVNMPESEAERRLRELYRLMPAERLMYFRYIQGLAEDVKRRFRVGESIPIGHGYYLVKREEGFYVEGPNYIQAVSDELALILIEVALEKGLISPEGYVLSK